MPAKELAVDLVLAPGRVALGEQKCSKAPRLATASKGPKVSRVTLPRVLEVDVEAVAPAGLRLRRGQRHPDAGRPPPADEVEQRAPSAAQVEHAPARADPDLLGHVLVLAPLSLLQGQREVAVVLGAAEVGQLPQAEPEDAVDQRVGELEVVAVGHRGQLIGVADDRAASLARASRR